MGGDVQIHGNDNLRDFFGLQKLKFVTGEVAIAENARLATLDGLESLSTVKGGCKFSSEQSAVLLI